MNRDRVALAVVPMTRPLVGSLARRRRVQFEAVPVAPGRVVFLGDSITQRGLWDGLLPELPGLNRGIDGDTTEDVLRRLDEAINQPACVSLLIGTNDLHGARRLRNLADIATRTERIVTQILRRAPDAVVFLNSVMPRTTLMTERIRELNSRYRDIALRTGATYVDLWPTLSDGEGALRKEFTHDDLHLLPAGYVAWTQVLRPLLTPFRREPSP